MGGLVLALLVFELWRQFEIHLGIGILSTIVRWGVFLGFLSWMWSATGGRKKAMAAITTEVSAPDVTTVETISPMPNDNTASDAPEDQYWAQALTELEGSGRKPGLWARVFAEAQGSESVAQAKYLSVRAKQLAQEHREKVMEEQRAQEQAQKDAELARLAEERRLYDLLPKGHCPSCEAVILMSAQECPKCRAVFTPGSAWKVMPIEHA